MGKIRIRASRTQGQGQPGSVTNCLLTSRLAGESCTRQVLAPQGMLEVPTAKSRSPNKVSVTCAAHAKASPPRRTPHRRVPSNPSPDTFSLGDLESWLRGPRSTLDHALLDFWGSECLAGRMVGQTPTCVVHTPGLEEIRIPSARGRHAIDTELQYTSVECRSA